jgi:hypothetical protein
MTGSVLDNPSPELLEVMFRRINVTIGILQFADGGLQFVDDGRMELLEPDVAAAIRDWKAEDKDYVPGGCECA